MSFNVERKVTPKVNISNRAIAMAYDKASLVNNVMKMVQLFQMDWI